MDSQVEKVYVALGSDLQDGFKTLDWTLNKWKPKPISIVILHVTCNLSKEFVNTPFGKMPASAVSDEKLEVLKKYEEQKNDKLLNKYIAFCGKVKAEILKVEKSDEPIHKAFVELISRHKINKLVMGISFMKSSSWKSKTAISGSFYIHEHKPEFCEFYLIFGGKLIILKGDNEEGVLEGNQGVIIAKKANFKSWIGKMFNESSFNYHTRNSHASKASSESSDASNSKSQWENCSQEIEGYYEQLHALNLVEEISQEEDDPLQPSVVDPDVPQLSESTKDVVARIESMKRRLDEAQQANELTKEEIKASAERHAKAEWAIALCNSRVEELEAKIHEEFENREQIRKNVDAEKEQIQELTTDVEQCRSRLGSILELQSELSNKLHISSVARSNSEAQLEKAVVARAEMVREIEELRRQRDVLHRRIEFCKEKDAIGAVTRSNESSCSYREYTAEDIKFATDDFSEGMRLKSGGDWTNVYRGRISHVSVAIVRPDQESSLSEEAFLVKVKNLSSIRHPHLVAIMGFCPELKCLVFEYMHNGSLRDILLSSQTVHKKRTQVLRWHDRIRIAYEVCLGLGYLHSARPRPIVHCRLNTSNVLLDRNLVAKISGFGLTQGHDECDVQHDLRAFGVLLLHLLSGKNWVGLDEEAMTMDRDALVRFLDEMAGQWPLDLAEELVGIAARCLSINHGPNRTSLSVATVLEELNKIRKKANEIVTKVGSEEVVNKGGNAEDSINVPSIFLCPIIQDVMKDPHIAADGFSYELEAIEEWLRMGRDTSPMTNLQLKHKFLTPNHTLRFLIQDWQNKISNVSS